MASHPHARADTAALTNSGAHENAEAAANAGAAADTAAAAAPGMSPEAASAVAAAYGYGAAAMSLLDPACRPGTEPFAAAKAAVDQRLQQFQARVAELTELQQSKPDMTAYSQLRDESSNGQYGHIAGVAVGDAFKGRGELAVLGLHSRMLQGVDGGTKGIHGAFAVCLSGGYKDDSDEGHTFWYTGVGGQGKGANGKRQQIEDQSYSHPDNASLVRNCTSGTPVRVFRAKQQYNAAGKKISSSRAPLYVYDGLYKVVNHERVPSQDGPLVCRYQLQGVPGHSVVSSKVEFSSPAAGGNSSGSGKRALGSFRRVMLAGQMGGGSSGGSGGRPAKQQRRSSATNTATPSRPSLPSREEVAQLVAERAAAGTYGRLVNADIAGGQEQVPIPMWNSVDNVDTIPVGALAEYPLEEGSFEYTPEYTYGEPAARDQASKAEVQFKKYFAGNCGIEYHGGRCCYTDDGLLTHNEAAGVMECDLDCAGPSHNEELPDADSCRGNVVLQRGIVYPLEVFKTQSKGWGVRCAVDIPVGAVLCAYIGSVVTDSTAELLKDLDMCLLNLDHFATALDEHQEQQQQQNSGQQQQQVGASPALPPPPPPQQQQQQGNASNAATSAAAAAAAAGGGGESSRKRKQQQGEVTGSHPGSSIPPWQQFFECGQHLVVDASHQGNVGRFINHSCEPNCLLQPVLARNARSHMLYYVAVVAQRDIPAFTELTFDYQYQEPPQLQQAAQSDPAAAAAGSGGSDSAAAAAAGAPNGSSLGAAAGRGRVQCQCGAANCRRWLLL